MSVITIAFLINLIAIYSALTIAGRLIGFDALQKDPLVVPVGIWSLLTMISIPVWLISLFF